MIICSNFGSCRSGARVLVVSICGQPQSVIGVFKLTKIDVKRDPGTVKRDRGNVKRNLFEVWVIWVHPSHIKCVMSIRDSRQDN